MDQSGRQRAGLIGNPVLLVGIIFTAFVAVAILTVVTTIGSEGIPGAADMLAALRCHLMGPLT